MNQILVTNDKNGAKVVLMKPAMKFFCVVAIVFALILLFEGAFALYNSFSNKVSYPIPVLSTEKNGSDMVLKISSEVGLNKIMYSWNNGEQIEYKGQGRKILSIEIGIPQGDNELNVSTVDIDGHKTKFEAIKVAYTENEDTLKPKISIENAVGKLVITATDDKELDYLSYQWEEEEEVKVQATDETKQLIKQEVNVQRGTKKLTMVAVDKAGNKETVVKKIVGSNGPQVKVVFADNNFVVKVTDDYKITKIQYTLNGEDFNVDNIPENSKEYEFKVPLKEGETNYLKINAFENDLVTEYKCKKTI